MTGRHLAIRGKAVELMAVSGLQRLEPFADGRRTHGAHQEADIWFSMRRYRERQQWVGNLNFTPGVRSPSISDRSRPVRWTRLDPSAPFAAPNSTFGSGRFTCGQVKQQLQAA